MENNQNNVNEIDVRKIVRVVLEHWGGSLSVLSFAYC